VQAFEVGDEVSMTVIEGGYMSRKTFTVAAATLSGTGRWVYQLKSGENTSDLYEGGKWFQESTLRYV